MKRDEDPEEDSDDELDVEYDEARQAEMDRLLREFYHREKLRYIEAYLRTWDDGDTASDVHLWGRWELLRGLRVAFRRRR